MLILDSPNKLGDKILSGSEALAKAKEEDAIENRQYQMDDHLLLTNLEARMGRPMMYQTLIERILKMNPNIWVEDSINCPGYANFYTMRGWVKTCLDAAFEKGALPEFSILIEDDIRKLPVKEIRGWWTVLYRLLAQRAITKRQIRKAFGPEPEGFNSARWKTFTRDFT